MRPLLIIALFALGIGAVSGQSFEPKFTFDLSDTITYDRVQWIDFDNDSLLDVLVSAKNQNGGACFAILKHDSVNGPSFKTFLNTKLQSSAFFVTDLDADNQMDILLTGIEGGQPKTIAFYNQGNFVFTNSLLLNEGGTALHTADVDLNGSLELMLSGTDSNGPFFKIYKGESSSWNILTDSIKVSASSIQSFDFNRDSFKDIFISGYNANGKPVSNVYLGSSVAGYFREVKIAKIAGVSSVSDLDDDGLFDILVSGKDSVMNDKTAMLRMCSGCSPVSLMSLANAKVFSGDFNSDGNCDVSLLGIRNSTDATNVIRMLDNTLVSVEATDLRDQAFGDMDRDGDLDLLQLKLKSTDASLKIFSNRVAGKNLPPKLAPRSLAVKIFNRLFMYWVLPEDDHTKPESLTYDVDIQIPGSELQAASFDIVNKKRLLVAHGNTGNDNYLCVKTKVADGFAYYIESVDNAYEAGSPGVCHGSGGNAGGGPCAQVETKTIHTCKGETISIPQSKPAFWYSLRAGAIGISSSLNMKVTKADTIISVDASLSSSSCPWVKVYLISPGNGVTKVIDPTRYACENTSLKFTGGKGWEQVQWSSYKKGVISQDDSIMFTLTQDDTVKLQTSNGMGCTIITSTPVRVSRPTMTLLADVYQIVRGSSVQLGVSGNAAYSWSPPAGLDNSQVANPVASPLETTTYTVTATDSIGCTAAANVTVVVQNTAFVPNLFTPNDDTKNDELKVYGLDDATNFNFSIYNREGSLMYSTTSVSELSNIGWNGSVHGVKQPAGVYFWKVRGKDARGENILLNGKTTGSIVLIR